LPENHNIARMTAMRVFKQLNVKIAFFLLIAHKLENISMLNIEQH